MKWLNRTVEWNGLLVVRCSRLIIQLHCAHRSWQHRLGRVADQVLMLLCLCRICRIEYRELLVSPANDYGWYCSYFHRFYRRQLVCLLSRGAKKILSTFKLRFFDSWINVLFNSDWKVLSIVIRKFSTFFSTIIFDNYICIQLTVFASGCCVYLSPIVSVIWCYFISYFDDKSGDYAKGLKHLMVQVNEYHIVHTNWLTNWLTD